MDGPEPAAIIDDILSHHGVKGMKWGVRKDHGSSSGPSAKKMAKSDRKFEKNATSNKTFYAVYGTAAKSANADIANINNKPAYKNADFRKDSPLRQRYHKEVQNAFVKHLHKAAGEMPGNASGTRKLSIKVETDSAGDWTWNVVAKDVKHADEVTIFQPVFDSMGKITDIELVTTALQQSDEVDEFLEHFGVLGMKWGVRRRSGDSGPTSDDAARAKGHASTAKKHGTKALTNKELQDLVTRMNLERQYSTLKAETQVKKGQKVIKEILGLGRTANDVIQFVNSPMGKHLRKQFTTA